jgi:hypothetical protein
MMAQQFCDDQGILFTCSTPGPYKIVIRKYKYANSSPTDSCFRVPKSDNSPKKKSSKSYTVWHDKSFLGAMMFSLKVFNLKAKMYEAPG